MALALRASAAEQSSEQTMRAAVGDATQAAQIARPQ